MEPDATLPAALEYQSPMKPASRVRLLLKQYWRLMTFAALLVVFLLFLCTLPVYSVRVDVDAISGETHRTIQLPLYIKFGPFVEKTDVSRGFERLGLTWTRDLVFYNENEYGLLGKVYSRACVASEISASYYELSPTPKLSDEEMKQLHHLMLTLPTDERVKLMENTYMYLLHMRIGMNSLAGVNPVKASEPSTDPEENTE
jgi:hypothetical protein